MKTFSEMKTNVGNNIRDTSAATLLVVGVYLNRRYQQILRAMNWEYYNQDYTVTLIAGTQDYELAADFGKEIDCFQVTDNTAVKRMTLPEMLNEHGDELTSLGGVQRYCIFDADDGKKYIRFHYVPSTAGTVRLPYIVKPADMSGDDDEPVVPVDDVIELGATADAFRFKRQFAKASDFETLYNTEVERITFDKMRQPNMVYQFKPTTFNRDLLV